LYKPDVKFVVMPFDEILEAVREGKVEAGLLIHEGASSPTSRRACASWSTSASGGAQRTGGCRCRSAAT
jgi:hypothetical protein